MVLATRSAKLVMRGGAPLVIHTRDGEAAVARAAEGSGAGDLELLRQLSGAEPALALSAQRVQALLGERPAGEAAVLRPTAGLESTALCALINPLAGSAPLADLLARLELSPARPCEQAAVRLAKLARLLPAALVAPLRTGAAELSHWALEHGLLLVAVEEIRAHDERATATLRLVSRARVPLKPSAESWSLAWPASVSHAASISPRSAWRSRRRKVRA